MRELNVNEIEQVNGGYSDAEYYGGILEALNKGNYDEQVASMNDEWPPYIG